VWRADIFTLGAGWFHPIFVVAALAIVFRFIARDPRGESSKDAYFSTALAATILAGYCVAMVTASADAVWQTNTRPGGLVVQMVATGSDRDDDVAETGGRIDRRRIAGTEEKALTLAYKPSCDCPNCIIDDRSGP